MELPATAAAESTLGNIMLATMYALGAFVRASGVVEVESVVEALPEILPSHRQQLIEVNGAAIRAGASAAEPLIAERRDYNLALKG
jgi:2-oxoglutarate ferredoxin oxidoreductase subunit gamma